MPAPRTCRNCGATLPPDVRWCGLCYEPVREFAQRPVTPSAYVGMPSHAVRTSRWRRTELTFGPLGRIVTTLVMFGILWIGWASTGVATPFGLWFFMGWFILATMVLKQTWRPVRIDPDETPTSRGTLLDPLSGRFPRLSAPVHASVVRLAVIVLGITIAAYSYLRSDTLGRFGVAVVAVMSVVSGLLIWLSGV